MSVNIKVTGGLNMEWGQIDPKVTGGIVLGKNAHWLFLARVRQREKIDNTQHRVDKYEIRASR